MAPKVNFAKYWTVHFSNWQNAQNNPVSLVSYTVLCVLLPYKNVTAILLPDPESTLQCASFKVYLVKTPFSVQTIKFLRTVFSSKTRVVPLYIVSYGDENLQPAIKKCNQFSIKFSTLDIYRVSLILIIVFNTYYVCNFSTPVNCGKHAERMHNFNPPISCSFLAKFIYCTFLS